MICKKASKKLAAMSKMQTFNFISQVNKKNLIETLLEYQFNLCTCMDVLRRKLSYRLDKVTGKGFENCLW